MMTRVWGRPQPAVVWIRVLGAGAGVWLMTGASTGRFGLGEILGLVCAVSYSVDIIAVNMLVRPGEVGRVTAGQFIVVGAIAAIATLALPHGLGSMAPARGVELLSEQKIGVEVAL